MKGHTSFENLRLGLHPNLNFPIEILFGLKKDTKLYSWKSGSSSVIKANKNSD